MPSSFAARMVRSFFIIIKSRDLNKTRTFTSLKTLETLAIKPQHSRRYAHCYLSSLLREQFVNNEVILSPAQGPLVGDTAGTDKKFVKIFHSHPTRFC